MDELSFDTKNAVESFKRGTTPPDAVEYLNVGRDVWHRGTLHYLDTHVPADRSVVRFVMGNYGEGKTHFLFLTAKAALDRHYVISYVSAESATLDRFDLVYRALASSLRTRDMATDLMFDFKAKTNGLKRILDDWIEEQTLKYEGRIREPEGKEEAVRQAVKGDIDQLDSAKVWAADFRHAIHHYLFNAAARTPEGEDQNGSILQWLLGDPLPKAITKEFDVYEPIKANSKETFRSLVLMLKELGYRGLVLLVDEVERTLVLTPKSKRTKAYENIRQLLDNAEKSGALSTYVLCAITPEMLQEETGFNEYNALKSRVRVIKVQQDEDDDKYPNPRAVVVNLALTPFAKPELAELARKVRTIHGEAMAWNAGERVPDDVIDAFVEVVDAHEVEISKPRLLVRTICQILDRAFDYPDYEPLPDVRRQISKAVSSLQAERAEDQESW